MDQLTQLLAKVELIADDIIDSKTQIVHLDAKRQKNREALNKLRELQAVGDKSLPIQKAWVCVGSMFIKLSSNETKNLISDDQLQIDSGIEKFHNELKTKVANLRELEGKPQLTGFNLKPLGKEEILSLKTAFKI